MKIEMLITYEHYQIIPESQGHSESVLLAPPLKLHIPKLLYLPVFSINLS